MRRHLKVLDERILDDVGVAAPCDADWNSMKGDERVRHCPACRQNVYNLSAMTRREAVDLVAAREGRVCIRMLRRTDGTLVTRDCRELLCRARQRGLVAYAVALVLLLAVNLGLRAWGAYALWSWWEDRQAPLMGAMVPPPPVADEPREVKGEMVVRPQAAPPPHPRCNPNDPLCGIDD
jgi:hypothetical protein